MDNLNDIQADLEFRMASLGVERFRRNALEARQSGEASRSKSMQQVLTVVIDPLASAILKFRGDAGSGRAGRRHTAVRFFEGVEAEALAFITAKLVLDGHTNEQGLVRLAMRVGSAVETEKRLVAFAQADAKNFKGTLKFLDENTSHLEHRRRVLMHMLAEHGDDWTPWTDREKLLVGIKLLELLAQSTGLFNPVQLHRHKRSTAVLEPTQRFRDWVATLDTQFEVMSPEYLPCVVPPKPWTGLTGGGYHTDAFAYPLRLVKVRSRAHTEALKKADLSLPLEAINAVQATPWRVHPKTLAVVRTLIDAGSGIAGLPVMSDEPLPTKPMDIDTNPVALSRWKAEAAQVHSRNASATSRRLSALKTLALAEEFAPFEAIYFPHQFDFRGRMYAVPPFLKPQGDDLAKGLLVFAEGDPIDTGGALDWLLTAGANAYGVDKVSFEARHKWVKDNLKDIEASAKDPLDHLWWAEADSPFMFLTWCFEFVEWARDPDYRPTIPAPQDGSCNGIQHYSAMLRDPVAGKAVNLVPGDKPEDIYAEVAKVVNSTLYYISMSEHRPDAGYATANDRKEWELAGKWGAFGIDRKITKRPVMVLPYGGTVSSCQKYVLEAVQEKIAAGQENPFGDDLFSASVWLGNLVWSSIGQVVVSSRLAMGWLQDAARVTTRLNRPLKWTTPSGFVVVQDYPENEKVQIETTLMGTRFRPVLTEDIPNTLDARRQVNGVAPNFVHSMDASALVLTVVAAARRGITKFAMIHDSYGTTPGRTPELAQILRDAFVDMYEQKDVLEAFALEAVPAEARDLLTSPPFIGGLDLNVTRTSPYFFA